MKKNVVFVLFLFSGIAMAQKTKVLFGSFENLKGIKEYNLIFDYKDLKVDGSNSEEEYFANVLRVYYKSKIDYDLTDIKNNWFAIREQIFEPKFIESFNKRFLGDVIVGKNLIDAKYTATVKTLWINPGCMNCTGANFSKINALITVAENNNPENKLLVFYFQMEKLPETLPGYMSSGFDPKPGKWIGGNYAKLAKEFAYYLKKSMEKEEKK